ncbi:hypothetical protein [Rubrimonas cliftonensis]|uniref:Predicted arabinose efflux permease, MFS family n=1 Tax=Rubrimonas cliftonensis TaxID=89524 RepID=A0A1H4A134_9RHOB|nr:hypothetical protein [Rubrimonas cliftonensis]SEA29580.1 Predicted arabinose efflux permease, MFS family [Rubrimonas cliftonensis]
MPPSTGGRSTAQRLAGAATGADIAPESARSALLHVACLSASKLADALVEPKLVLAWLLTALGASAGAVGLLTPIREAGALAPQLLLAPRVAAAPRSTRVWALAAAGQGLCALAIAAAALAGASGWSGAVWAILAALAALSVFRALASLSFKDALARTVEKGARGAVGGAAASVGAALSIGFALALAVGWLPLEARVVAGAVAAAGGLWLLAGLGALAHVERPRPTNSDAPGLPALARALVEGAELRRFILVRALLTATALAPPYLVLLSGGGAASGLGDLGALMLASAAAAIVSGYVWGRLSDRSSRLTLAAAAALAALALGGAAWTGWTTGGLGGPIGAAGFLFAAQIAYEGVRGARKTHLTDMSDDDDRALNTALSNTAIGLVLLAAGGLAALAEIAGAGATLAAFAAACALAAPLALTLDEAQRTG